MKKFKLLVILVLLSTVVFSQVHTLVDTVTSKTQPQLIEKIIAKPGETIIPYEKWEFPNGLTLIIHEDYSDPIVLVAVTYHVGSARESVRKTGFAHFFEHMMFQGSDNVGPEEHFKIISEAGGTNNAFTSNDITMYFETVPSNQLEVALWLEADRMGFFHDAMTQEEFENQRDVIKNEKKQGQTNQPYGMWYEVLGQNLYPMGHPYNGPVIGYLDDLDSADVNDAKNFFLRWYGPNNATLVVAGDIDSKEVLKLVEKYFGKINKGPDVRKQRMNIPIVPVDKYANITDDIFLPLTVMVFPCAPRYHRDEPALDILAIIMGQGKNSIFYKNFVKTEKAIEAFIFNSSSELAGEFMLYILAYPELMEKGMTLNETEELIRKTIEEFGKKGITDDELLRAKTQIKSGLFDNLESIASKSYLLAGWHIYLGKTYNFTDEVNRYEKVTKEDVIRVFNKYIKNKNATIVNVVRDLSEKCKDKTKSINPYAARPVPDDPQFEGLTYKKAVDNFARSKKPTPGTSKPAVIPEYYQAKYDNGIKIIGTKTSEIPKISILINIEGGHLLEEEFKHGTASLTALLMNEATQNYTTEQISAELERIGSAIYFGSGTDNTSIFIESLTKNIDATLKLLEEKLFHPAFNQDDFKRVKKQLLESIKNQKTSSYTIASKVFKKIIYGNTILGSYYTGTYSSVSKIKLDDVKSYYEKYYSPSVTRIVIVGDISEQEIIPKLDFLKQWKVKDVKIPTITAFPEIEKTTVYFVNKDNATSSLITIGYLANPYDALGTYFKTNIMNFMLGRAFTSRINLNLREDKGYTYGARSYFQGAKYPGPFVASTTVEYAVTDSAIVEIMKEINNYKNNGITDEELSFTKNSILLSDVLEYETLRQKASFLSRIIKYNLPKDYVDQQTQIVKNITKDEINKLAKEHLPTDKMVILVVGEEFWVKKPLKELGYGKIIVLDKEGN